MSTTRPIVLAGALAAVLALGAPIARAQAPGDEGEKSAHQKLRDRLVELRTQVEVLQLDHEADKADLRVRLRGVRKLQREGVSALGKDTLEELQNTVRMFVSARANIGDDDLDKLRKLLEEAAREQKESAALDRYIRETGLKNVNPEKLGRLLAEGELAARISRISIEIEQKRAHFVEVTRQLNARKLELEDAEWRYQHTR